MKPATRLIRFVKQIVHLAAVMLLVSLAADYWRRPRPPAQAAQQPLGIPLGGNAPITLAQAGADRTLVLYFWGSWCRVCTYTSPAVQRLHDNGIPVFGVALQSGSDAEVAAYLRSRGWHFATFNDPYGQLSRQWQIRVTPTIVLLRHGRVVHSTSGLSGYWGLRSRIWLADRLGR